jgi:hypothetical protein
MKKYAIDEIYLVRFYLFYFQQDWVLFIKSKNWDEEKSRYTQKVHWLANSLALIIIGMESSGILNPKYFLIIT